VTTATVARGRRLDATTAFWLIAIVGLIVLRVVAVAIVLDTPDAYKRNTAFGFDTARYHHIAEADGRPYRDFKVEFPPATLAYIEAVNGSTIDRTMHKLAVANLLLDIVAACGVAYGWGRRAATTYLVLGVPFLILPFIYFRIDLLSVALAIWGMALVKHRHEPAGGLTLVAAVLAKFWPLALIPALLVWRRWRALLVFAVVGLTSAAAWVAWSGTAGVKQVLTFRGAHGWNVESVVGGFVRIVAGGEIYRDVGAIRTGTIPSWASPLLGLALVSVVACIWWQVSRARRPADVFVSGVAPVTAVCAFLVFSPVLSPQYLVWLLPFGAVCWVGGQRRLGALVGVAVLVTMVLTKTYSGFYDAEVGTYVVLTARNLLLLAIIVEGFRAVAADRRQPAASAEAADPDPSVDLAGV
jgi:hypothetical protein